MTDPAPSKILPNSYMTPNFFVDGLMRLLTGNEQKCVDVVCRKTFGWQKRSDRISKSQIVDLTGLSDAAVDECMASLVRYGVVVRVRENVNNLGVEWSPQTEDALIDVEGLKVRKAEKKSINAQRAAKARAKKEQGGVVAQPQDVAQPQGGDVGQPPQKTLSKDISSSSSDFGEIFALVEQEIGELTPMMRDKVNDALNTYPYFWIPEAISIAVSRNARSWDYVEGVLKKCLKKGVRPSESKSNRGQKPATSGSADSIDEILGV